VRARTLRLRLVVHLQLLVLLRHLCLLLHHLLSHLLRLL
jgi:hypothetical protein